MRRKPNFFIVGAPKCGTSALAEYLGDHPAIFMSDPKEPHYFALDFPAHRCIRSEAAYEALFDNATNSQRIIGEASVLYLYSREAIPAIRAFNPEAKLVAMLRNPVEVVHAMHAQAIHSTDEDVHDFTAAWNLQNERRVGRRLPRNCRTPQVLLYRDLYLLGEQVERMLTVFPREQVKLVLFDDFKRDPGGVYRDVLDFLRVPDDRRSEFPVVNANKQWRFYRVAEFVYHPPNWFRAAWRMAKRLPGLDDRTGARFNQWMQRVNTRVAPRDAMAPEVKAMLTDAFAEDVRRLGRLVRRDLSSWLD